MRIRKRQVPLPLSSLSPVPLSDLHMEASVQLPPPPSDHQNQRLSLIRRRSGDLEEDEARSWNKGEIKKSNDSKNPAPISSSNNQAEQRWCDGDKAFPPKKRRGNNNIVEKDEATTMKSKMKNKSSRTDHVGLEDDDDDDDDDDNGIVVKKKKKKKKKKNMRSGKGGEVMEGSRCSRVNGRGWRCCQQTLVGYSLCEHHLGKGRLRSMSVAPKMTKKNKKNIIIDRVDNDHKVMSLANEYKQPEPVVSCFLSDQVDGVEDEDDEEEVKDEKRSVKLGMVKARSMSSLLGQTQQKVIVTYAVSRDHNHMQI